MKYPYEILSYVRKKTFSVEARFSKQTEESPLKVFDHFSRFVFCIIQDKKPAYCNIPISVLGELNNLTDICYNKHISNKTTTNSGTGTSIGFTTRFVSGNLKGKSPVEVLIENPENGKDILNKQYLYLKENLSKYPNNKHLMDAIMDASSVDIDSLNGGDSPVSIAPITLMEIGCRPLVRKRRQDGKCFCYECKVIWDFSKDYPVICDIRNYYAPVIKKDNGLLNVAIKEKDTSTEIHNEFSMTAAEWLNVVDRMKLYRDSYYLMNINQAIKSADENYNLNRRNAQ